MQMGDLFPLICLRPPSVSAVRYDLNRRLLNLDFSFLKAAAKGQAALPAGAGLNAAGGFTKGMRHE